MESIPGEPKTIQDWIDDMDDNAAFEEDYSTYPQSGLKKSLEGSDDESQSDVSLKEFISKTNAILHTPARTEE